MTVPACYPRAFPNKGVWCWVNSLLQALATLSDDWWWELLDGEPRFGSSDLLASLAEMLRWINRRERREDNFTELPPSQTKRQFEIALTDECCLSPSAEQDVHEALVQVLEAVDRGLLRRQVHATRFEGRALTFRDCFHPLGFASSSLLCSSTSEARKLAASRLWFELGFTGLQKEVRVCLDCELVRVMCSEARQSFRCVSLDIPPPGQDLFDALGHAYSGVSPEKLEGVICPRCSTFKTLLRARYEAACGSLPAIKACQRIGRFLRSDHSSTELPQALLPPGASQLEEARSVMLRSHSIVRCPRVLLLHLRRLGYGMHGPTKSDAFVGYPELLKIGDLTFDQASSKAAGKPPGDESGCANDTELIDYSSQSQTAYSPKHTLRAVVSHFGTAWSGHYVTHRCWEPPPGPLSTPAWVLPILVPGYCLWASAAVPFSRPVLASARANWICADDDRVSYVPKMQAMRQRSGYIFVYEQLSLSLPVLQSTQATGAAPKQACRDLGDDGEILSNENELHYSTGEAHREAVSEPAETPTAAP
eukprot:CAMPEP_0206598048 /NCGR_PEP_ID=MMETSP0325_2-20121206/44435_1 /ASSEMBLY_ACC=CAM_ASM_000347 /TAXON_ID=2866 /ORGANISM="Crypthecodinium cohnii, Strain Seligo" /LENGTH=535 /DNA_ID=CAMNT_0054109021 /DNA_START=81 /DNA_END=1688 /DNA_ORIENTATION=+